MMNDFVKALNDRLSSKFFASYIIAIVLMKKTLFLELIFKVKVDRLQLIQDNLHWMDIVWAFLLSLPVLGFYYFGNYLASGIGEWFEVRRGSLHRSINKKAPVDQDKYDLLSDQYDKLKEENKNLREQEVKASSDLVIEIKEIAKFKKNNADLAHQNEKLKAKDINQTKSLTNIRNGILNLTSGINGLVNDKKVQTVIQKNWLQSMYDGYNQIEKEQEVLKLGALVRSTREALEHIHGLKPRNN